MEKRDLSFVDTTSNRLERRNIIIKDKIVKFPGKRSIDVLVCLRSYFLLQNIDCLSRIKSKNDPGIKHKKVSIEKHDKILSIIDSLRLRKNKTFDPDAIGEIINQILSFFHEE